MSQQSQPSLVILGGGLSGLLLALALKKRLGIIPTVYEQAPAYGENIGGAIGMYPNGLRVLRDIDTNLLMAIRAVGVPYQHRRWMRHDGSEIAVGTEKYLCHFSSFEEEKELSSFGIRRFRLQRCLAEACAAAKIPIIFGERVKTLTQPPSDHSNERVLITFETGRTITADLVFGCDGARSATRAALFGAESEPSYTGVTVLMGSSQTPRPQDGICFPSSVPSKCHAVFYPTAQNEQAFQIYFPTEEKPETWKTLSEEEGQRECEHLAKTMRADGWHPQFVEPLLHASSVIRVGLRARDPISCWHKGRVVLLGDAAHPPVPYIGQGAMMAFEDVGVLSLLLKRLCLHQPQSSSSSSSSSSSPLAFSRLSAVFALYEALRIPRCTQIYRSSHTLGAMQLQRAGLSKSTPSSVEDQLWWEAVQIESDLALQRQVWRHNTLPVMWVGSDYDYRTGTLKAAAIARARLHSNEQVESQQQQGKASTGLARSRL